MVRTFLKVYFERCGYGNQWEFNGWRINAVEVKNFPQQAISSNDCGLFAIFASMEIMQHPKKWLRANESVNYFDWIKLADRPEYPVDFRHRMVKFIMDQAEDDVRKYVISKGLKLSPSQRKDEDPATLPSSLLNIRWSPPAAEFARPVNRFSPDLSPEFNRGFSNEPVSSVPLSGTGTGFEESESTDVSAMEVDVYHNYFNNNEIPADSLVTKYNENIHTTILSRNPSRQNLIEDLANYADECEMEQITAAFTVPVRSLCRLQRSNTNSLHSDRSKKYFNIHGNPDYDSGKFEKLHATSIEQESDHNYFNGNGIPAGFPVLECNEHFHDTISNEKTNGQNTLENPANSANDGELEQNAAAFPNSIRSSRRLRRKNAKSLPSHNSNNYSNIYEKPDDNSSRPESTHAIAVKCDDEHNYSNGKLNQDATAPDTDPAGSSSRPRRKGNKLLPHINSKKNEVITSIKAPANFSAPGPMNLLVADLDSFINKTMVTSKMVDYMIVRQMKENEVDDSIWCASVDFYCSIVTNENGSEIDLKELLTSEDASWQLRKNCERQAILNKVDLFKKKALMFSIYHKRHYTYAVILNPKGALKNPTGYLKENLCKILFFDSLKCSLEVDPKFSFIFNQNNVVKSEELMPAVNIILTTFLKVQYETSKYSDDFEFQQSRIEFIEFENVPKQDMEEEECGFYVAHIAKEMMRNSEKWFRPECPSEYFDWVLYALDKGPGSNIQKEWLNTVMEEIDDKKRKYVKSQVCKFTKLENKSTANTITIWSEEDNVVIEESHQKRALLTKKRRRQKSTQRKMIDDDCLKNGKEIDDQIYSYSKGKKQKKDHILERGTKRRDSKNKEKGMFDDEKNGIRRLVKAISDEQLEHLFKMLCGDQPLEDPNDEPEECDILLDSKSAEEWKRIEESVREAIENPQMELEKLKTLLRNAVEDRRRSARRTNKDRKMEKRSAKTDSMKMILKQIVKPFIEDFEKNEQLQHRLPLLTRQQLEYALIALQELMGNEDHVTFTSHQTILDQVVDSELDKKIRELAGVIEGSVFTNGLSLGKYIKIKVLSVLANEFIQAVLSEKCFGFNFSTKDCVIALEKYYGAKNGFILKWNQSAKHLGISIKMFAQACCQSSSLTARSSDELTWLFLPDA